MAKTHATIPVFIPHLGCPHRCAFCSQASTSNTMSMPTGTDVSGKIERYLATMPASVSHREVAFFGGSFTGISPDMQRNYLQAVTPFLKKGDINGIRLSTRPDYIDNNKLSLLREHGVTTVELGVQSFRDHVLAASRRGHTVSDVYAACEKVKDYGFQLIIQLMPGLPGESADDAIHSANEAVRQQPDGVRIYPTVVLSGTELEKRYRGGTYTPMTLKEAVQRCTPMYELLMEHNIPVIRLGLHPFDSSNMDAIIAGPYHPAFGFMVKSRYRYHHLEKGILEHLEHTGSKNCSVNILIPATCAEEYIGHRRENIRMLREAFPGISLSFSISNIDIPAYRDL